jgi:bifunctional DNA-binding transcriptional regulator/antitoxin component of YhaV-PrlF toxin-antitoxin module
MGELTVTGKGQITLRKDLLRHLGVGPGDKISVDKLFDRRAVIRAERPCGKINEIFDFFKRQDGPVLSIEEINEIAAKGWAGTR